ncbi:hypothetical protein SAMN04487762_0916 [Polaribacter sp. Hel1_33_78]|nr:hypothetical protein SAMN04487762_0916 [Polaribacter sp. Hel1_33_78]
MTSIISGGNSVSAITTNHADTKQGLVPMILYHKI